MLEKAVLTFLLYILSPALFAQQKNLHTLQMMCVESKLVPLGAYFKLIIHNNTADTFLIPDKIFSGPINSGLNFGYEVQYVDECGDSTDLTKNLYADIHYATTIPWNSKNTYSLLPGKERIIEQYIDDGLLEKKGNYLVRFSLYKGALRTNWIKIVQTKDKIWRRKSNFKETANPSHS